MNRRSLVAVLALSLLGTTGIAHALEIQPFDDKEMFFERT